jgi:uncharacterized protein (TIGR04255 family)
VKLRPIGEAHSIDEFLLAVRIVRPVSDSLFAKCRAQLRDAAIKADMPATHPYGAVQIPVQPGLPEYEVMVPAQPAPSGVAFQRYTKLGTVEEEIRLEPAMISYRTTTYRRWADVEGLLERILFPVLKEYLVEVPSVLALVLQYVDRFFANEPGDQDCSELFLKGSPWIVTSLVGKQTLWHSHCGVFEDVKGANRRLININVDVSDQRPPGSDTALRSVAILTLCSDQFTDTSQLVDPERFPSEARARFQALHNRSKDLLAEVLSKPYQERISLTAE